MRESQRVPVKIVFFALLGDGGVCEFVGGHRAEGRERGCGLGEINFERGGVILYY